MRYVMEVTVFLMLIAVPAFVLATLILVLAPLVFGDSIPQRDQASDQDGRIGLSARAEFSFSDRHLNRDSEEEVWVRVLANFLSGLSPASEPWGVSNRNKGR